MISRQNVYKGLEIAFDDTNRELVIDKIKIPMRMAQNKYYTPFLPYTNYNSIMDLSRAVIDSVPAFYNKTRK